MEMKIISISQYWIISLLSPQEFMIHQRKAAFEARVKLIYVPPLEAGVPAPQIYSNSSQLCVCTEISKVNIW